MEQFRTRITRCCRRCRDDAKLYLGSDVFQVKMTRFREAYQECVFECADDNIKKLPVLKKKLDKLLGAPAAPSMPMPK